MRICRRGWWSGWWMFIRNRSLSAAWSLHRIEVVLLQLSMPTAVCCRLINHADYAGDGEAHDVEVVAVDAGDPAGGVALDAVGPGLVERLGGGAIEVEFGCGDFGEGDCGGFNGAGHAGARDDGYAGKHLVHAAGEAEEDALRVLGVVGLGEDFVVEDDGGVGTEDEQRGFVRPYPRR